MVYRNGTYVAFDGQDTTDPTKSDMKYYGLLQKWNQTKGNNLKFSDSHKKTYRVLNTSSRITLQTRLIERLKQSKNMLIIISKETAWDRGMLNFEIEKAIDIYELPLIIAYAGQDSIPNPSQLSGLWPKELATRISSNSAKCIHIPFREKAIMSAISQFSIHSTGQNVLNGPLIVYSDEAYRGWGYK
ncbi:hypothetical protein HCA63_07125 [Listeria booriae]|uniref:TIR domain-containing protein n=1 Tax=Listeria booriae TaxID=1552123 RepID=UPI0016246568|nr:TIR domain-containing protein [Listeria booriae]MBC1888118.1 hypothetical protein [Listeria booriae]